MGASKMADIIADLKKEPVDPPPPQPKPEVKLQVYQQAVQFQFVADAPKSIVEAKMDEVWAEREPTIPPQIIAKARKGFRAQTPVSELRKRIVTLMGGHEQFYEPALLKVVSEAFNSHEPKPNVDIFSWSSVASSERADGTYNIVALGYFEPEVVWKAEKPKNFKVVFHKTFESAVADMVKAHMATLMEKHKVSDVNNDLAITAGFESVEQLTGTVTKLAEDKVTRTREDQAINAVKDFLFEIVKISPIPDSWRQFKAQEAYQNSLRRFKSEQEFLRAVGANDRVVLLNYYSQQIAATLAEQLVFKSWAAGVVEGDAGLENLYGYVESVHKHILKNMETSEVEDANGKIQVEAI
jgi:hypothetical protein